jgi:hypothetical protein
LAAPLGLARQLFVATLVASAGLVVPPLSHAGTMTISSAPRAESGRCDLGVSGLDWCHGIAGAYRNGKSDAAQQESDPVHGPQPAVDYIQLLIVANCAGAGTNAPRKVETSASSPGVVSGGMTLPPLTVLGSVALVLMLFPESPPGDRLLDPPRSLEFIPHELTECGD